MRGATAAYVVSSGLRTSGRASLAARLVVILAARRGDCPGSREIVEHFHGKELVTQDTMEARSEAGFPVIAGLDA